MHISSGMPPMIRIDGDIRRLDLPIVKAKKARAMILDVMNDHQRKTLEENSEVDYTIEISKLARFRVNTFIQNRGIASVFRVIPDEISSLEQLRAPEVFKDLADNRNGLVLVTGATGTGKSTTLAALVDYINHTKHGHIITIEDPIEFVHKSDKCLVNQREVFSHTKSFSSALRSSLREDPDFILLGEMRDPETIRLALTAAETGQLVLGTLHTTSAPKTIHRIVDVFPAAEKAMIRAMLAESLRGVISQALIKRVNGGRMAVHEIMVGIPAIRNLIRDDKLAQMYSSMQTGSDYGMVTFDQSLKNYVSERAIAMEEARSYATIKANFS